MMGRLAVRKVDLKMKLLLFSDLHRDREAAEALSTLASNVDVVVGAGDFASLRQGLATTIEVLQEIDRPAVLVPGNAESVEELTEACRQWPTAHVLHGTPVNIAGVSFFGIGGAIPITPFGSWSYDFSEDDARALLANCSHVDVLVTHSPPKGVVDVSSRGDHLGSAAIREAVEQYRPDLVVCGHIHDSAGKQATLGPTTVINAGPLGLIFEFIDR